MAERNGSQEPQEKGEVVNNSAALEMIRVDKLMKQFVQSVLGEEGTHRPTTNVHRRSLDDYNHTFEWSRACFHS